MVVVSTIYPCIYFAVDFPIIW